MRRVVVTGMGAITPIGLNVEEFWKGIHAGQIGFGPITKFDASEYKAHLAAEVKGFVGKEHMDFKAAKRMELFAQYAVAAAKEAVDAAFFFLAVLYHAQRLLWLLLLRTVQTVPYALLP